MEIHRRPNHISGGFLQPNTDLGSQVASLAFDNSKLQSDFLVLKQKIVLTDSLINSYASCKNKLDKQTKELSDFKVQYESLNARYGSLLQKHISVNNELEECKKSIKFLENDVEITQTKAKASESLVDQLNAHIKNLESKIKENDVAVENRKMAKSIEAKISKISPKKKSTIEKPNHSLLQHAIVFGEKAKFANALTTAQLEQLESFKKDASDLNITIDYIEEINENLETGPPSCCSADSGLSQDDPKFDVHISESASTCSDYSKTSDSESYHNKINIVNNRVKSYLDQVTSPMVIETKTIATSPLKFRRSLTFMDEDIKNCKDSSTYVTEEIIDSEYLKEKDVTDEEVNEILMKIKGSLLREITPMPSDDETKYSPVKKKIVVKNKFRKEMKRKFTLKKRSFMSLIESLKNEMKMNRHYFNKKIMKLENNITVMTDKHKEHNLNLEKSQDSSNTPVVVTYKDIGSLSDVAKSNECISDASENCQVKASDENCTKISDSSNTLGNNCDISNTDRLLREEKPSDDLNIDFDSESSKSNFTDEPSFNISEDDTTPSPLSIVIENSNDSIDVHNIPVTNSCDRNSKVPKLKSNQTDSNLKMKIENDSKNVLKPKQIHVNETELNLRKEEEKEVINTTNIKAVSEIKIVSNLKVIETNLSKIQKNPSTNNKNTNHKIIDYSDLFGNDPDDSDTNMETDSIINRSLKRKKYLTPIDVSAKKCKKEPETIKKINSSTEVINGTMHIENNPSMSDVTAKKRISHFVKDAPATVVGYSNLNKTETIEKAKSVLAKLNEKTAIMKPKVFLNRVARKKVQQDNVEVSETSSEPKSKNKMVEAIDDSSDTKTNASPVDIRQSIEENKSFDDEPIVLHTNARKIVSYEEFDEPCPKYEDGDHILTPIIMEHLNECRKFAKKQPDAYENDCANILKLLEATLNSAITTTSLNELTQKLEPYKEKLIAHSLVLYISEAKTCETAPVLLPKMPVMSYHHQSALCFMQKLRRNPPVRFTKDIFKLVMENIEFKLFQLNNTPKTDVSQKLSLFYAILCFATKQKERLKVFCMDALYCMSFKSISVIASAMQVWPQLFPRIDDKLAKDPLVVVMMHLITSICNKDKFKVENLSLFILKNYGYRGGERNDDEILETFKEIMKNNEHHLLKRSTFMALLLFGKRCGATWCHKNILLDFLFPILDDVNASPECKLFAAELIGPLSRPFPPTMTMQREIIREKLNMALKNEAAPVIQEAIVCSLVSLSNRCFHRIVQDIIKWRPATPISVRMANTLRNFVKDKPPKFWNNNSNYVKKRTE